MSNRGFYDRFYRYQTAHAVTEMLLEEKRAVIADLLDHVGGPGGRVLFVGCGTGEDTEVVAERAVALDLSGVAVAQAKRTYGENLYLVADGCELPFPDNSCDTVVCSEVIEHVEDAPRMIGEFWRILGDRGVLVLTTPNWASLYGVARWLGELVLRRPITAAGQPVDHWRTRRSLGAMLSPFFTDMRWQAFWLFPPVGWGHRTLPLSVVVPLLRGMLPVERRLRRVLGSYGHVLAVTCVAAGKARSPGTR